MHGARAEVSDWVLRQGKNTGFDSRGQGRSILLVGHPCSTYGHDLEGMLISRVATVR